MATSNSAEGIKDLVSDMLQLTASLNRLPTNCGKLEHQEANASQYKAVRAVHDAVDALDAERVALAAQVDRLRSVVDTLVAQAELQGLPKRSCKRRTTKFVMAWPKGGT